MDAADAACAAFLAALSALSLASNLSVLLCFARSADIRRQVAGVFIVNLSVCNVVTAALHVPATAAGVARRRQPFGERPCRAVGFLELFLTANAALSAAALSVDRWVAVVFPLSYSSRMRRRDAAAMLCYTWLHSFTFSLAALLFSWLRYSDAYASCTLQASRDSGYAAFTMLFHASSFALPLLTLCVAYLKVLRVARFHCKKIDVVTVQTLVLLVDVHPSVKRRCLAEQKRRKQRAVKKISVFIGSFIVCFGPLVFTRLAELLPFVDVDRRWGLVSKCLTYSKAACDPFAYCLTRKQYKKVLTDTAERLLRRKAYPSSGRNSSVRLENDYCLRRIG
ncbi:G-protein coupled receptor 26-like [Syngnathoides biaculeatus]|uniref:G-protein coupled receptor 26-like n=1 Tax=Syngnathoides biaculeatus TaxID=300417 RepID=UPI002ADE2609|nr:G-protein coupled receptor 26-like [Syngnathoides biaculeatus]